MLNIKIKTGAKKINQDQFRSLVTFFVFSIFTVLAFSVLPSNTPKKWITEYGVEPSIKNAKIQKFNNVHDPILKSGASAQFLSPNAIKEAYHLKGDNGGSGTIAIVDADNDTSAQNDLNTFSAMYNLPSCTVANGCFTQYVDSSQGTVLTTANDSTSGIENQYETTLDIEWAHAIAPNAKILLIEEASLNDWPTAVQYATQQPGVIAVSMSLGGPEISSETAADPVFTSQNGQNISFFGATGDSGYLSSPGGTQGAAYPSTSPNVIAVGGTSLNLNYDGSVRTETAWSGSNGGISQYETQPSYQANFRSQADPSGINNNPGHMRTTPDVSLNANPSTGYPIYSSQAITNGSSVASTGWMLVGGTSAATPIWAAIDANDHGISDSKLYQDASSNPSLFRDITTGNNGPCGVDCNATTGYDFVTGLGVPNSYNF